MLKRGKGFFSTLESFFSTSNFFSTLPVFFSALESSFRPCRTYFHLAWFFSAPRFDIRAIRRCPAYHLSPEPEEGRENAIAHIPACTAP